MPPLLRCAGIRAGDASRVSAAMKGIGEQPKEEHPGEGVIGAGPWVGNRISHLCCSLISYGHHFFTCSCLALRNVVEYVDDCLEF